MCVIVKKGGRQMSHSREFYDRKMLWCMITFVVVVLITAIFVYVGFKNDDPGLLSIAVITGSAALVINSAHDLIWYERLMKFPPD